MYLLLHSEDKNESADGPKGMGNLTSHRIQGHVRDPFGKRVPGKANTSGKACV